MKATELFTAEGKSAGIWLCGECRFAKKSEEEANDCCPLCECGAKRREYVTVCEDCRTRHQAEREQKRLDDAETVLLPYEGFVYDPSGVGYQDGYFNDSGELLGYYRDEEPNGIPEFVYCCTRHVLMLDIDSALESLDESGWEEMTAHAVGLKELREAVDVFNTANSKVFTVWNADYSRKIAIKQEGQDDGTDAKD